MTDDELTPESADASDHDERMGSCEMSDGVLLRRFQAGESDAATAIYVRYAKRLQSLARSQTGAELALRVDPEDVVQSVFRTFFRRAAEGHYEIPAGEELWKLFLVIALNKVRALGEFHRAKKRSVSQTQGLGKVEPFLAAEGNPDENAFNVLKLTINDMLDDLPEVQRQMVLLRIEGHDVRTIAERTGRSKRSVERALQEFRVRLSQGLEVEPDDSGDDD